MDHFVYRDGSLWCEDVPVATIAESVGTPAYIYSAATIVEHYKAVERAFADLNPIVCYSIKSCGNIHVCGMLQELGSGFDVVSGGELVRALEAGGDPKKIVYAGVGKTDDEIELAMDAEIGWFNIESEAELAHLIEVAKARGETANAALRVNPDVDPKTHRYTTTGLKETKFGVDLERARRVFHEFGKQKHVRLCGIHLHIGSPVNSVDPYVAAIRKGLDLIDALRADGFEIDTLDIGGGFGANYREEEAPPAVRYAEAIVPLLKDKGLQVILEPGRAIAANAGILLSKVLYLKQSGEKSFVIVDGSMTELIRPALYDAYHFIWPVAPGVEFAPTKRGEDVSFPNTIPVDVVGPVCESSDFLGKDRMLPSMKRGDLLAVFSAGAYGFVMASHYNSRPNPPEVLVEGDTFRVIRRRETYDDLLEAERV